MAFLQTPELSDLNAAKSQIRQLQEENQQLKQRVSYVSLGLAFPHSAQTASPVWGSQFKPCGCVRLAGAGFELPVAEVRLQQGGVHPGVGSEAEGELRAGPDAGRGLHPDRPAPPGDFQAQRPPGGKNQGVLQAGQRSGGHKEAGA